MPILILILQNKIIFFIERRLQINNLKNSVQFKVVPYSGICKCYWAPCQGQQFNLKFWQLCSQYACSPALSPVWQLGNWINAFGLNKERQRRRKEKRGQEGPEKSFWMSQVRTIGQCLCSSASVSVADVLCVGDANANAGPALSSRNDTRYRSMWRFVFKQLSELWDRLANCHETMAKWLRQNVRYRQVVCRRDD